MPYYHLNSTPLTDGSVILPGNWGRIIQLYGTAHGRFATEACMEDVRAREFADRPSRLRCSFFFDHVGEARFYRDADHSRLMMILYEVEASQPEATVHRTDWRGNAPDDSMDLGWVRRYWRGEMMPRHESGHRCQELLAETPLQIVRRLDP